MTNELAEIVRRTGLDRTLAVGEMILTRFFHGHAEEWRVRRKNKKNSIRRLADHPGCPLSRSALSQAVGVYVAVQALPCVRTFGHIDAGHVAAVLPLSAADRERWLRSAEQRQWSVRDLKREITEERRSAGERRGRPSTSHRDRALSAIRSAIAAIETAVTAVTDYPAVQLDLPLFQTLMPRVQRLGNELNALCERATAANTGPDEDETAVSEPAALRSRVGA